MQGFHLRLRQLRQNKRLTLDALAKQLGTTKTTLSRYENNKRLPDAEFIVNAAQFFNVSTDYILNLTNHPTTVSDFLATVNDAPAPLSTKELLAMRHLIDHL